DQAWRGDSLQLRVIAYPDAAPGTKPPMCWVTAWSDRDGKDLIDLAFPNKGGEPLKDAKTKGAQQAFLKNPDGPSTGSAGSFDKAQDRSPQAGSGQAKGYTQEIALPWKTLIEGGLTPQPGQRIRLSLEANFNLPAGYRITTKDIFCPGVAPDRVFAFSAWPCWGFGTFAAAGKVAPQTLRLSDNREFPVAMKDSVPVVDWTRLFEERKIEGFAKIPLDLPEDGFVSLNIKNAEGRVVRQLLNASFLTKGSHEILWDGLTNLSHRKPGEVVEAGAYTWEAIYHTGIGLRLVGWADNAGKTPFSSPGGNWGGDHGNPCSVTTDGKSMYLGWNGSEAGRALVCTDLEGKVKWRHKRGGFGGARQIAVADGVVYVHDVQKTESVLYRLDARTGEYSPWEGQETAELPVEPGLAGLDAAGGKLYLSQGDGVRVLDAKAGKELTKIAVSEPGDLEVAADGTVYVLSGGTKLLRLTSEGGVKPVVEGLKGASGLAIGPDGVFYLGVGDPDNQVLVFDASGKALRTIGKKGGRPLLGPWDQSGLRFISGLRIDPKGGLWVAEKDGTPKRFSCWNAADGSFLREFFGPTQYGAPGGSISPDDPLTMAG
ncbi:MAG: PQQ-binding-like beta-propeller repeat protein, partial [Lentisphaerota bacterium]